MVQSLTGVRGPLDLSLNIARLALGATPRAHEIRENQGMPVSRVGKILSRLKFSGEQKAKMTDEAETFTRAMDSVENHSRSTTEPAQKAAGDDPSSPAAGA
jgi:hypothetical protein